LPVFPDTFIVPAFAETIAALAGAPKFISDPLFFENAFDRVDDLVRGFQNEKRTVVVDLSVYAVLQFTKNERLALEPSGHGVKVGYQTIPAKCCERGLLS
jgi:hypothetical protein